MKADLRIPIKDYSRNKKTRRNFPAGFIFKILGGLSAVVADGLDGTAFLGFFAARFLFGRAGLLVNDGVPAVVVALEIFRRGFAAQVAVNALVINVVFASGVFGIFVCGVSHKIY
jgi:hypothetical protein